MPHSRHLRMTPRITADEFVQLTIFEEVSDIDRRLGDDALVGDPAEVGPTTTVRSAVALQPFAWVTCTV